MKRLVVEICVGTACHLLGSQDLMKAMDELPQELQERIDVQGVTCLRTCGRGPNVRINGQVFISVTPDRLIELLNAYLLQEEDLQYVASD